MSLEETDPVIDARILLIEDSRDRQFLYIRRLNKIGIHNIIVCETGKQGLDKIKTDQNFNLIIVEYNLPEKSGIDIIQEIRNIHSEIPVLLIIDMGSEKVAVKAMKLGIQDYLTKEDILNNNILYQTISRILLEHHIKQATALTQRLENDPDQISISIFKFGIVGPVPVLSTRLPFEESISRNEKDDFLIKIGTQYMTATGAGHAYSKGLFELPVPDFEKYHALVYGFRMAEKNHMDKRILKSSAQNYGLVVLIFPILLRSILPNRAVIEKRLEDLLNDYSDMNDLDKYFLMRAKRIFISS